MTTDQTPDDLGEPNLEGFMPPRARRPGLGARHMLFVGVAGACALGVGLGLWARPAMSERQAAIARPADAPPKPQMPARKLVIVVDDRPAPFGAPIDVLPANVAPHRLLSPPAIPLALIRSRPVQPPEGLVRVQTPFPSAPTPAPPKPSTHKPAAKPKLARLVVATLAAPRPESPKAKPPKPAPVRLIKAVPASKPAHRIDAAHALAAKAQAHRIELARAAKAARLQQIQLAKAEAEGRAEALAEARTQALGEAREDERKRIRVASLVRTVQRVLPHQTKPHAPAPVEVTKLERKHGHKPRHDLRVEQASLKTRKQPHFVAQPTHAAPFALPQRSSGLMRVSTSRCASRDPGEALVCGDRSLGAADRQLARAYQSARAAGVPDAQLRQQQQRWLSARSSAAREAPWAVHDVYLARIAELNGQAREAHGDGY